MNTYDTSSYVYNYAEWKEKFKGAGNWEWWPWYRRPCDAAKHGYQTYLAAIHSTDRNDDYAYITAKATFTQHWIKWYGFWIKVTTRHTTLSQLGGISAS